mmetsp:Transcript_34725/g.77204  ORF Transcript_34725/g.77204 Transcript_34725/m.77204 type:complete len:502 (+) Transcript_34725:44-1549(+)
MVHPTKPTGVGGEVTKKAAIAGGTAAVGLAAFLWYYNTEIAKAPHIYVGEGLLKERVYPRCTVLQQPYRPTPWALNTHVHTILGLVRKASIFGRYTRQLIITPDGGTIGLDWWMGCDAARYAPADTPILLVLHGINGGSHEGYCKWVCAAAVKKGWRAVVLNYRGCNGLPLTAPRGYTATMTYDVQRAIVSMKGRFPTAPLFASGYSLGGLILAKYLSESDSGFYEQHEVGHGVTQPPSFSGSGLVAAAVVSSPVCLANSLSKLSKPWTIDYMYNLAVAWKLREFIKEHRAMIKRTSTFDIQKALNTWEVQEMENQRVSAEFGYLSRMEYYEQASSLDYIPNITTPTLFLLSRDDPFLGVLPDKECAANPNTLLASTKAGGHIGFLQGMWPLGYAYMDGAVVGFLDATLKHYPTSSRQQGRAVADQPRCQQADLHSVPAELEQYEHITTTTAVTGAAGPGAAAAGQGTAHEQQPAAELSRLLSMHCQAAGRGPWAAARSRL